MERVLTCYTRHPIRSNYIKMRSPTKANAMINDTALCNYTPRSHCTQVFPARCFILCAHLLLRVDEGLPWHFTAHSAVEAPRRLTMKMEEFSVRLLKHTLPRSNADCAKHLNCKPQHILLPSPLPSLSPPKNSKNEVKSDKKCSIPPPPSKTIISLLICRGIILCKQADIHP